MEASNPTAEQLAARAAELDARERALTERETATQADVKADDAASRATGAVDPNVVLTPEEQSASDREKAARPHVDQAPQTPGEVQELAAAFAEYRKEVAALREELRQHRPRVQQVASTVETPEQRAEARLVLIADHSHYCPGCGALGKYAQRCTGPTAAGHAPIEMVSTDELGGDPASHTRAPNTEELAA